MTRTTYFEIGGEQYAARRGTGTANHILRITLRDEAGDEVTDEIGAAVAVRNAGGDDRLDGFRSQILGADRTGWTNDVLAALIESATPILAIKNQLDPDAVEVSRVVVREQDAFLSATPK